MATGFVKIVLKNIHSPLIDFKIFISSSYFDLSRKNTEAAFCKEHLYKPFHSLCDRPPASLEPALSRTFKACNMTLKHVLFSLNCNWANLFLYFCRHSRGRGQILGQET